ncbi:hypothetical protein [Burkholderia thailandensis]|uniref:hypothetical protein n=1 Tax=Burkholderia thailandensis TaxID=57975 RepID=UPI0022ABC9B5|nr:hypothetical protein [Burkholderia thailandensis]MCZ2898343.1 hypothetical protein [Burkholderia thailandensis]
MLLLLTECLLGRHRLFQRHALLLCAARARRFEFVVQRENARPAILVEPPQFGLGRIERRPIALDDLAMKWRIRFAAQREIVEYVRRRMKRLLELAVPLRNVISV